MKQGAKLTLNEFVMLFRLYFTYNDRYGTRWQITNYADYWCKLIQAYSENVAKDGIFAEQIVTIKSKKYSRASAFDGYLSKHSGNDNWNKTIEYLEEYEMFNPNHLIDTGVLLIKDIRNISNLNRDIIIARQEGINAYDGSKLDPEKIHFDHKNPHSKGGKSTVSNIVAISKDQNAEKSTLTEEEYRLILEKRAQK
jgi:hypothetical protein